MKNKFIKSVVGVLLAFLLIGCSEEDDHQQVLPVFNDKLSSGDAHTCAVVEQSVVCWGLDRDGQSTPPALSNPVQVSAGAEHSCALDDNGVVCWGLNGFNHTYDPIFLLRNPTQISSGGNHNCALDGDRAVCWGGFSDDTIAIVIPLNNPSQISVGSRRTCALENTGTTSVVCWENSSSVWNVPTPELSNPTQVSVGPHMCAVDDTGLVCWSANGAPEPYAPILSNPTEVELSGITSCALDDSGVVCWHLATADSEWNVPNLSNPTQVSTGASHQCFWDDNGVSCVGDNTQGQLDVSF